MNYPEPFVDYFESLELKLTSLRKAVLYILWCSKKPSKAYEVLSSLLVIKPNATPPTVYRALDYFVTSGILHKIESIQSYTLCCEPVKQLQSEVLMVCNTCHQVIETYDIMLHSLFSKLAGKYSFNLNQSAIELKGICENCN